MWMIPTCCQGYGKLNIFNMNTHLDETAADNAFFEKIVSKGEMALYNLYLGLFVTSFDLHHPLQSLGIGIWIGVHVTPWFCMQVLHVLH